MNNNSGNAAGVLPISTRRPASQCRVCNASLGPLADYYRESGVDTWNLCGDCHATACADCGSACIDDGGRLKRHVRVLSGGVLSCGACC